MSRTPQLVSIKRRGRRGNGATRAVKRDVSVIDWRLWMLRLLSASLIIALLMVTASVIHQVRSVEIGDVMITGYSADAGMSSSGANIQTHYHFSRRRIRHFACSGLYSSC